MENKGNNQNNQIQSLFQKNNDSSSLFFQTNETPQAKEEKTEISEDKFALKQKRDIIAESNSRKIRSGMLEQIRESLMKQNQDEYKHLTICTDQSMSEQEEKMKQGIQKTLNKKYKESDIDDIEKNIIESTDSEIIIENIIALRKMIQNDLIDLNEIDLKMVPNLIKYMQFKQFPRLQAEVTAIICNLCAGNEDNINSILNIGGLEKILLALDLSQEKYFRLNLLWSLGNICAEDTKNRDYILQSGSLSKLITIIKESNEDIRLNSAWLFINICSMKPYPKYQDVKQIVEYIVWEINTTQDLDLIAKGLRIVKDISFGDVKKIRDQNHLIQTGIFQNLKQILISDKSTDQMLSYILTSIGNYICDFIDENFKQFVVEFIDVVSTLMYHNSVRVRQNAVWVMVNFANGKEINMRNFFQNKNYSELLPLMKNFAQEKGAKVQFQILELLKQITTSADFGELEFLIKNGILNTLDFALDLMDKASVLAAARTIGIILEKSFGPEKLEKTDHTHPIIKWLENKGTLQKLEALQQDEVNAIYETVYHIIEYYFPEDDSEYIE